MYRRYFGISAIALAGLMASADSALAQETKQGSSSGERREGASSGDGGRVEGESRGGYYGLYGGAYYGPGRDRGSYSGRGWYGSRRGGWYGDRGYYGSGYPMYDNGSVGYSGGNYDGGSYDGGRRGRFFGRRRGGDYSYGSYGYGSSCHGGCYGSSCHGGYYGAGCTGGYYGAGCTGGSYYGSSSNGSASYGAMSTNGGALIQLKVPADATVTFDNEPTQQTGEIRQFITPPLEANKSFSYQVHVKAQNLDETRKINVSPDKQVSMDFTMPQAADGRAAPEQAPAPGRQPYGASKGAPKHELAPLPEAKEGNAPQAGGDMHEGTFVSFSNGKLEMTDPEQGKHSHQLSPDTKVFIDGQPAKAEDLKADMKLKITTKMGDPQSVIRIDAQVKGKIEAPPPAKNEAAPKAKNNEAPQP